MLTSLHKEDESSCTIEVETEPRPESCRDTAHDINDQHPIDHQPTSQQEEDTQEASRNSGEESDSSGSVELF